MPLNAQKLDWIKAHLADATKVANQVGTTASNILGISALEGGWGQGPFVVNGGNNFFGQHFPAPFGGPSPIPGHAVPMAQFPNYATSAESFAKQNGGLIRNVTDPTQFAKNLQNSGKFGIDPTTGKPVPDYVSNTSGTIKGLQKRIDCPQ